MEGWGRERLRDGERSPGGTALCLPWEAWARGPAETTPHRPANLRPAPSSLQEWGRNPSRPESQLLLGMHPRTRAVPCLPSLGTRGWGLVRPTFWSQAITRKNVRGTEGKGRKGEEGRGQGVYGGVTTSDTQNPKEEVPRSLALALPPGSTRLSVAPPPQQPRSCEEGGLRGREEERAPQAAHGQP